MELRKKTHNESIDFEMQQEWMKSLKSLNGNLNKTPDRSIGQGGDGRVYLWELKTNESTLQVAAKSITVNDREWQRYVYKFFTSFSDRLCSFSDPLHLCFQNDLAVFITKLSL